MIHFSQMILLQGQELEEEIVNCLTCSNPATTPDGLCADCALAGSDWTGLYDVTLWIGESPAATADDARAVLKALGWPDATLEEQHAESGAWLLELPPLQTRLLLTHGHLCHAAGGARVEVDLP